MHPTRQCTRPTLKFLDNFGFRRAGIRESRPTLAYSREVAAGTGKLEDKGLHGGAASLDMHAVVHVQLEGVHGIVHETACLNVI